MSELREGMVTGGWNMLVVEASYEALGKGDMETTAVFLAADIEWWFHGPPGSQHMMRVLTGKVSHTVFRFNPRRVVEVGGGWVVVEGWEGKNSYWVHVWAVEDSIITRLREYFNTSVIVRELGRSPEATGCAARLRQRDPEVWKSERGEGIQQSLPGLVFAI